MILSGSEILHRIGEDIEIDPFHQSQLNPNSYNLTLIDWHGRGDEPSTQMDF